MNKYQWQIKPPIKEELKNQFPEVSPVILQLLIDRNLLTQEKIDEFLHPDYSQDIHDPYLFSQMKTVVDRIYLASVNQDKVVIYGDYDADGVCGAATLHKIFKMIGLNFEVYLPDRELEGYGLNQSAIKELAGKNVKLIITVDCGISNVPEVDAANQLGMEVIITDHHHLPEVLPKALAIIHPELNDNYPFKHLSGGGVAFKIAQALIQDSRFKIQDSRFKTCPEQSRGIRDSNIEKWLLDLVAISTVADMVPLLGENRTLVKYGLKVLNKTKNLGLQKLIEVGGIKKESIDTYTIGWQIAPRINAAGRMAHANSAFQLLTTENIEEAISIASQLNKRNQERQSSTESLVEQAKKQLGEVTDNLPVIFAGGQDWPAGLVGLVASKLTNLYARPSIIFSQKEDHCVASGRSIEEFNLIEELDKFHDYFERYGGHSGAAGFSMKTEKFAAFKESFMVAARQKLAGVKFQPKLIIDAELKLKDLSWPLVETLAEFEPFGQNNYQPRFLIKNLTIIASDTVGQEGKHLRLMIKEDNLQRKVIAFGFGGQLDQLNPLTSVDIVCEAGVNEWNGSREIQLSLVDFGKR